ncbi:GxxExxY protein [Parerythrobacter lacustris]|uniref:GxxExxY protein n=1 Tax=Parerythrobacter lacustris TaxID=2969984 RepID=A0ABT1XSJ2_9SPHN|nr:GxxExxY protein [Parerythrobacter lacustris]MCR2834634.1 GxxExxY protein [Parerythrobacter lacustris]
MEIDDISAQVIDACIAIHRELGPGLLESVYEIVLAGELELRGLKVDRQVPVDIEFRGRHHLGAFRVDLLVEDCLVLEIKSVEQLNKSHAKQVLTYLRLMKQPVGLLLNFAGATMKEGIRRIVNQHRQPQAPSASPRLRVIKNSGEA